MCVCGCRITCHLEGQEGPKSSMNLLLIRTARGALGSTLRERERERERESERNRERKRKESEDRDRERERRDRVAAEVKWI